LPERVIEIYSADRLCYISVKASNYNGFIFVVFKVLLQIHLRINNW